MTTRGDEEELSGNGAGGNSGHVDRDQIANSIGDAHLPKDLRPGDDNPLAEGLAPSETAGDLGPGELLHDGKQADQEGDDTGDDTGENDAGD